MENIISIGIDIEEVARFENKTLENSLYFLKRIFSEDELRYCFSDVNSAQHLCARFCAKEAVIKALSEFNISDVKYGDIEILNKKSGAPAVRIDKYPDIKIKISLSHTKTYAAANVLLIK